MILALGRVCLLSIVLDIATYLVLVDVLSAL